MKISNNIIARFQEGGAVPAEAPDAPVAAEPTEGADPAAQAAQDPIMQLADLANQALQGQDCQAALAVCEAFLGLIQGGGGEPAPAPAPEDGAPVFKKGGKIVRRVKS